jgi:Homing endonuclease associated repeat
VRTHDAEMTAGHRYTDEDMLNAMRQAARLHHGPLTVAAYDEYQRAHGGPSGIWLLRRFGTWRAACQAVGAQCNATRSWSRRWSDTDLIEWVAIYLASPDAKGTYNEYLHWARETPDAPSGPTVRTVFPRWGAVKNVAANMVAMRAARTRGSARTAAS